MPDKLKVLYQGKIVPTLMDQFKYTNIHQVPKLVKVTVNRGLGEASQNAKALDSSINEIGIITGQKPVVRPGRHSQEPAKGLGAATAG